MEDSAKKLLNEVLELGKDFERETEKLKFKIGMNKILMSVLDYSYTAGIELTDVREYIYKILEND